MAFDDRVSLPADGVLVHIGPHKTGTTVLQSAFHAARHELRRDHRIWYAGRTRQPMQAAIAVSKGTGSHGRPPAWHLWDRLVKEVTKRAAGFRVVVSSEFFCEADDAAADRIVRELGGDGVHIAITLRPLAGIFPSQWQQYVQNGLRASYDDWLERMLANPGGHKTSPYFWRRHAHADLVERWARIVGPQRVVVVVPDPADRGSLLRGFETILDLPSGALVPEPGRTNRSLTLGEIELIQRLNREFRRRGWGEDAYHHLMRLGVIRTLLASDVSGRDEPRMSTPQWAIDRFVELGNESARRIEASGVVVVGDLSVLALPPSNPAEVRGDNAPAPRAAPSASTAVEAVVGAMIGSGFFERRDGERADQRGKPIGEAPWRDLAHELARRGRRRLGSRSGK
jgi:hypothetical protein